MECAPWYSHPAFVVPSFPGLVITVFFLPFPNWPKRQALLFSPVREMEGYRSMQFFFFSPFTSFLALFQHGSLNGQNCWRIFVGVHLCAEKRSREHIISPSQQCFLPVSHISFTPGSWGKELSVSQMERDLTAGKDWEKAWRFLLMDSSKDTCKGLQVWQQRLAQYSWRSAHDPEPGAKQKLLVSQRLQRQQGLAQKYTQERALPVFSVWVWGFFLLVAFFI